MPSGGLLRQQGCAGSGIGLGDVEDLDYLEGAEHALLLATLLVLDRAEDGRRILSPSSPRLTCHRELAELYEKRLREKGLTVTAEPSG